MFDRFVDTRPYWVQVHKEYLIKSSCIMKIICNCYLQLLALELVVSKVTLAVMDVSMAELIEPRY